MLCSNEPDIAKRTGSDVQPYIFLNIENPPQTISEKSKNQYKWEGGGGRTEEYQLSNALITFIVLNTAV